MVFQKGHPGGLRKGKKNKATILKEERRAIFEAEMSEMFLEKIREARPEYLLDQYLGKAPDKLELDAKIETTIVDDDALKAAEIYAATLRKRKAS